MSDTVVNEGFRPPAVPARRREPAPDHPGADRGTVIALEAGATYIKGYALGPDGVLRDGERWFTRPERGPDAVLESVLTCAATLAERCRPTAAGVILPGTVDDTSGRAVRATALGWQEIPVRDWVAEHLELPVAVGHDGRAGGLAEAHAGAGRDCRDFLFVSVGDGIAAAVVRAGRAVPGAPHAVGELGHTVVRPGGDPCHCGARGCLETVASAAAVARRYARATGWRGVDVREVYHRADAGEPAALAVCGQAAEALADVLATAIGRYAPERVVIAGRSVDAGAARLAPLQEALAGRLGAPAVPELRVARFGATAGCMGAAFLARDLVRAPTDR
ncbi:ROK family protein [Streptomyces sp. BE20]|uniref:ROK family protein n=1 Tax=unclassified Streptomyces TaxID=2593676 RepID=UPI002E76714B|nr:MULTISPECIES: ROK family protein [unclassified Streptomyces]MED7948389.1 ROK family protein [Streptomyces sp. BE303]MEE1822302.1 ROK family protein [Streptomyces sp. BE20]